MDKIILAYYINTAYMNTQEMFSKLALELKEGINDDSVIQYIIPIKEGDNRVECVYPKFVVSDDNIEKFDDVINRLEKLLNNKIDGEK